MTADAARLEIVSRPHLFDDTESWLVRVAAVEARIVRERKAAIVRLERASRVRVRRIG